MAHFYDLVDVIYFRKYKSSPRRVVFEAINDGDRVLDLCTGTVPEGSLQAGPDARTP